MFTPVLCRCMKTITLSPLSKFYHLDEITGGKYYYRQSSYAYKVIYAFVCRDIQMHFVMVTEFLQ